MTEAGTGHAGAGPTVSGHENRLPLGELMEFAGARAPEPVTLRGRYVTVRPLRPEPDARPMYEATHAPAGDPSIWTYLLAGPYESLSSYRAALEEQAASGDPLVFVAAGRSDDRPTGQISYMSIVPEHGRIELGGIWFSAELRRTAAATEAIFLLARHAFDELGNRRLEWKCNALNAASRSAAVRFGFEFEGVFRNHQVVKGRNRDTAWFAITDERWPAIRSAFEAWLAPENFDGAGNQIISLRDLTAKAARTSP